MKKATVKEIPFYCKECGKCGTEKEVENNLRIKNNTGWTHDIYCMKQKQIVYRM
jgi:predicted nucleic acid-binding Zn ribbon protein